MIVGLGGLGSVILELLARERHFDQIVIASRDARRGPARCNLARLGALAQGYQPDIRFIPLDLHEVDAVGEAISVVDPHVLLCTASLQAWWLPDLLPPEPRARLRKGGFGIWCPVHLTLPLKLMDALSRVPFQGHTLMAPFPDVVNVVLGRVGHPPTCGIGNLDEVVPKLALLAAERLEVASDQIHVTLVAHHALERAVFGQPQEKIPPYHLRIEYQGEDVTEQVRGRDLLITPYPIPSGPDWHFLTAGSTLRLLQALTSENEVRLHVPGPHGLPGGYPVRVSRTGVRLTPIQGLSQEEAIAINERSHPFDGIEKVDSDGTVVFTPQAAETLWEVLGLDKDRFTPGEAEPLAEELIARFRALARQHNVPFPRG
jgi:hypothetical protein